MVIGMSPVEDANGPPRGGPLVMDAPRGAVPELGLTVDRAVAAGKGGFAHGL